MTTLAALLAIALTVAALPVLAVVGAAVRLVEILTPTHAAPVAPGLEETPAEPALETPADRVPAP